MYSARAPNMRLKLMPPPPTTLKELLANLLASEKLNPGPAPTLKVKRLMFDCVCPKPLETTSPIRASWHNMRLLNGSPVTTGSGILLSLVSLEGAAAAWHG